VAGGGALVLAGVGFQIASSGATSAYDDDSLCFFGGVSRDARCGGLRSLALGSEVAAVAGFVAGGAALATGLALLVTGGGARSTSAGSLACHASLASVACAGRF
jgi:hypothetical protein